jgi:nitrite reductase (NADH) large subunit
MEHLVDTYECEWKATLESPERLTHFQPFVNSNQKDESVVFVKDRLQHRPAMWSEKKELARKGIIRLPMVEQQV